eukprot:399126-Rhodomonas_salina.2
MPRRQSMCESTSGSWFQVDCGLVCLDQYPGTAGSIPSRVLVSWCHGQSVPGVPLAGCHDDDSDCDETSEGKLEFKVSQ